MRNYTLWMYHKKEDGTVIQTPVEMNIGDRETCPKCNSYFLIREGNIKRCAGCFYISCHIDEKYKNIKIEEIKNCFYIPINLVKEKDNWYEVKYELNSAKEINVLKDKILSIL